MRFHSNKLVRPLLVLAIAVSLGGCAGFGTGSAPRLTPSEKMMWSTYAIGTAKGMATCIIINRKDPSAPNGVVPVLVTATHVLAAAPHGPYYLAIRTPNPNSNPNVSILAFKPAWLEQAAYAHHPHQDIAALELRIPAEMANFVQLPSFIDENAIGQPSGDAHAGDSVAILGFPKIFPGTEGAFPILRAAKVASYSTGAREENEKFLVNTNVYSGDSGGPVFAGCRNDRPPILLGLVIERIGEKVGDIPLAVAVDAYAIRETLQLLTQNRAAIAIGSSAPNSAKRRGSTVKTNGSPDNFMKVVRGKRPAALPLPVADRN